MIDQTFQYVHSLHGTQRHPKNTVDSFQCKLLHSGLKGLLESQFTDGVICQQDTIFPYTGLPVVKIVYFGHQKSVIVA